MRFLKTLFKDCPALQYKTQCPTSSSHHVCKACYQLPPHVSPVVYCFYICKEGYYHYNQTCLACLCLQCKCSPGFVPTPCTLLGNANCNKPCVNTTKSLFNSKWTLGC